MNGTMVAVEGETVSILCSTQSNPDPILTIFKEKQILATVIYESELQLELPAVTPEDDGEYWCVAENQFGQRATAFNLSVECKSHSHPHRPQPPAHSQPGRGLAGSTIDIWDTGVLSGSRHQGLATGALTLILDPCGPIGVVAWGSTCEKSPVTILSFHRRKRKPRENRAQPKVTQQLHITAKCCDIRTC